MKFNVVIPCRASVKFRVDAASEEEAKKLALAALKGLAGADARRVLQTIADEEHVEVQPA